jgi:hypothetical protein
LRNAGPATWRRARVHCAAKTRKLFRHRKTKNGWENIDGPLQFRRSLIGHSGQINFGERGISPFIRKVSRDPNYQKR